MGVSIRGGFSDRNGIKPLNTAMQVDSLDNRTRIIIYQFIDNMLEDFISYFNEFDIYGYEDDINDIYNNIYIEDNPNNDRVGKVYLMRLIKRTILNESYDDVLSILEYITNYIHDSLIKKFLKKACIELIDSVNKILKEEYVGYRFINKQIVPITNEIEQAEIEQAVDSPYKKANDSLNKAIHYLSDRKTPDYENSIKESITAVEFTCNMIFGTKLTLNACLQKLEDKGVYIHQALKQAFIKLYAYTSDESGIRHGNGLGAVNSTFEEAKFMLVSCSAFINYLIEVSK